ncbi:hypothetical protein CMEL01_14218 [Colletotrichum melonis]|uniref:FAD-binding domain-containing protein n=1 Tax=Colletotrichum melonis TaxID=1209925 RepID=A0AAI9XW46_9PEZI|nr:hypothetical protein CMEL01_14218 [Colletotrichum melonis]
MAQHKPFKVVIVGGSIAGLTLANMLQVNDIDFVVLERHPEIAPQVGASIGLLPHGNRILDQLGVFDRLMALSTPVDTFTFRNDSGHPIAACRNVNHSFYQRHGFPIAFLDRQTVLQVLYDNIRDKSKILTSKRVTKIELSEHDSSAFTADGLEYTGDILIGADGVHSTVRREMKRLARKLKPGVFSESEEQEVACDYQCIFGISRSCPGVNPGDMNSVFRDKASYLVIGGSNGRTYWFRFQKFHKRLYGSEVPRYTEREVEETVATFSNEYILPGVQMSELIRYKVSVSMTPLVEHVYSTWHVGRATTVGDSCHKFHPIGGHGGNAAIETAACLTNLLVENLKASSTGRLTTYQLNDVFSRVQATRHQRSIDIMKYSHSQQLTEALDSGFRRFTAYYLLPLIDKEDVTFNFSCQIPASEKLNMLPIRREEKLVPFKDDLLREPKTRGPLKWLFIFLYVSLAVTVYYGMWILPKSWNLIPLVDKVIGTGTFEWDASFKLVTSYTGVSALDEYLVFLAVIFMPGLRGWNSSFRMMQVYFLGLIGQPICIWTIESFRRRNALTLLAFPSLWFILFQSTGIGFFMPLYYAVYTWISDVEPYWWPLRRAVPIHYAKALLPSTLLGYFLPTVLMFLPWHEAETAQYWETFWQPSPCYVPLITMLLGTIYRWQKPLGEEEKRLPRAKDEPTDVAPLKQLYLVTGSLGVLLHWYVLLTILGSPTMSFAAVFFPTYSVSPMLLDQAFLNIFVVDFWGFFIASYVWCVGAVWDLRRVGRTDVNVVNASFIVLVAHLGLGPGAAMSAIWYWREERMAMCLFPAARKLHSE